MPELPEVETMRAALEKAAAGALLRRVEVRDGKIVLGRSDEFARRLRGKHFVAFGRHGKVLQLKLDNGDILLAHPRMTGKFLLVPPRHKLPDYARVIFYLDRELRLVFADLRRFGRLELVSPEGLPEAQLLRQLGPDALDIESRQLYEGLQKRRVALKVALMDQKLLAGLGNIYAAEILHRCGWHPCVPAHELTLPHTRQLTKQIHAVLHEAIQTGGTTIADYLSPEGHAGGFREHLRVYGRAGEKCLRRGCPGFIQRMVLGGRSTFYCPLCQKQFAP